MLVVSIRKMWMEVSHWCMPMHVSVLRTKFDVNIMLMLMMLVVDVFMIVFQKLMHVSMVMPFSQVQPDTQPHQ
jgi:hypothetical protein